MLGRPTDYREWMDKDVIEKAKKGMFLQEIAVEWGVAHKTLWLWSKEIPSFCKAYAHAKEIILAGLLRDMHKNRDNKFYNPRTMEIILSNVTRGIEKREIDVEGINAEDFKDRVKAVLGAANGGRLRPDEFKTLLEALKIAFELEVGYDLEEKIENLKDKIK